MSLIQGSFSDKLTVNLPGISKLNNFEFEDEGVRVWQAYGVGEGKVFRGQILKLCNIFPEHRINLCHA